MAKRVKKPVLTGITEEEFHDSMGEYATADAEIAKVQAQMDVQITKIREKYLPKLEELSAQREKGLQKMQVYCEENKDALFAKKKSLELNHGTVGFRTGTPKLKNRRGFTWAAVIELAKEKFPRFVRQKEELDKAVLLASRENEGIDEVYDALKVDVVQDESFFVELKKEEMQEA